MSNVLPKLRGALDLIPSPQADRPGLLIRDPFQYTEAVLYLPPQWAFALQGLDGEHTELDLQEMLTRATGNLVFSHEIQEFSGILRQQGFLRRRSFSNVANGGTRNSGRRASARPPMQARHTRKRRPRSTAPLKSTSERLK